MAIETKRNSRLAPVALFAFRRPKHTQKVVDALLRSALAAETDLIAFIDGPITAEDQENVHEVTEILEAVDGFRSITIHKSPRNRGLSSSIIGGISSVLADHDRVIVLEDDIVVSRYFLDFMNSGLAEYSNDMHVASIHGYCYPVGRSLPELFFLRGADCWGWATWARAWSHFNPSGQELLDALTRTGQLRDFDLGGSAPYSQLLRGQIQGTNDSWAIRWHASAYLSNMYTLYPGTSLVRNIGIDGSGTHSGTRDLFASPMEVSNIQMKRIPVVESRSAQRAFAKFFEQTSDRTLIRALWTRLRRRRFSLNHQISGEYSDS